jgi:hypothetical protein
MVAGALVLVAPIAALAQNAAVPARITAQINESNLTTLRGNTHPLARAQYDQGAVADSQPMRRMLLLLQRSPQQETALRTLIDQQQSKSSPSYHQWLTPQQFGQQYGPAPSDIQAATSWLTSHGFQIARVSTAGTLIEFSGTAGQVLNAFHTQIHRYVVNGEEHLANSSDPQIPTAIASVVAGPVSLHNFPRKAQSHNVGVFRKNTVTGQVVPLFSFNGCSANSNSATGSTCNAVGPGDFANIYNVQSLWTAGIDGTGETIAIVGDSEICTATSPDFSTTCSNNDDVATFRSIFGLPAKSPNVILDGPDPGFNGDEIEGNLDVQWSGAVAKGATIDFVIAETTEATAGTDLAAEYIVDNNLAPVLSESFSACEAALGTNGNQFEATLWEQAAAQGTTVIVSAGDSGSAGCDNPDLTSPNAAQSGVFVNGLASTPFNVAAGGTDFDITAASYQSSYWSGANASVNGINDISATKYIPETTWNDSCAQNFTAVLTGCNSPSSIAAVNIVAGGGGQSNCSQLDTSGTVCTGSYPKPAWQTLESGFTSATDITRDLPDISLFAADGMISNSFYAICDANFSSGPCSTTPGFVDIVGVGGTSSAAPTFAGIMALVNQKMAAPQGNANYVLYNLAKSSGQTALSCSSSSGPAAGCIFNDVTKGNNSVPCSGTTQNCSNTQNSGAFGVLETLNTLGLPSGTLAFNAETGLDMATGLGSVNAANLVSNWPAVGAFTSTATTLCLSTAATTVSTCTPGAITIKHGAQVWVNISVTPSPGSGSSTKAEDVSLIGSGGSTAAVDLFTANNYVLSNADIYSLTSGTVSGATTTGLVGGTYNVIAHYAGDGTFGGSNSTGPISVTVNPEASTTTLSTGIFNFTNSAGTPSTSAYYGDSIILRADVVGASGQQSATGSVTILDAGQSLGSFALNTEGYTEDQTGSNVTGAFTPPLAVGSHSFTANFNGDPSYAASNASTPLAFTVVQAPTTVSVTPSVTTVAANTAFSLSAFVDTQSNNSLSSGGSSGAAPTGSVTFFAGTTNLGSANVSAALDANGYVAAQVTLANVKLTATSAITATYSGDTNYTASPTPPAVTVTVSSSGTFTLTPANGAVMTASAPGQSATDTIAANGTGFSGTITLTVTGVSPSNVSDIPFCSFGSTGTITLNASSTPPVDSGSGTLTCNTTAAGGITLRPSNRRWTPDGFFTFEVGAVFVCLFLLGVAGRKRRGMVLLGTALFAVVVVGTSCGSSSGGGSNPGTTVGTYTVTVTGTPSSGSAQQTTVTLTVN